LRVLCDEHLTIRKLVCVHRSRQELQVRMHELLMVTNMGAAGDRALCADKYEMQSL